MTRQQMDHATQWIINISSVKLLKIGIYFYFLNCLLHFWPVLLPDLACFYCAWHCHTIFVYKWKHCWTGSILNHCVIKLCAFFFSLKNIIKDFWNCTNSCFCTWRMEVIKETLPVPLRLFAECVIHLTSQLSIIR